MKIKIDYTGTVEQLECIGNKLFTNEQLKEIEEVQ